LPLRLPVQRLKNYNKKEVISNEANDGQFAA
jgi:hypothetical protein